MRENRIEDLLGIILDQSLSFNQHVKILNPFWMLGARRHVVWTLQRNVVCTLLLYEDVWLNKFSGMG